MRINKSLITNQVTGAGTGSVTSVAMTVPTGLVVTGSPISSSGTLAISFASGVALPPSQTGNAGKYLTTDGTNLSWGNISGTISGTANYVPFFATSSTLGTSPLYYDGSYYMAIGTTTTGTGRFLIYNNLADTHLQVSGTTPSIRITDTPTSATYNTVIGLAISANSFITNTVAGDLAIDNSTGGNIIFGISNSEKLRIFTSTGNVSINGTSTDTGDKLYVSGGIKATAQLKLTGYTSTSAYPGTAAGYLAFDSAGNILSAAAPSGTNIYNSDGTLSGNRTLSLSAYYLRIAGTTTTSFFSTGNVTIGGTTDAGYKVDVQGTLRVTGDQILWGAGFGNIQRSGGAIIYGGTHNTTFLQGSISWALNNNSGTLGNSLGLLNFSTSYTANVQQTVNLIAGKMLSGSGEGRFLIKAQQNISGYTAIGNVYISGGRQTTASNHGNVYLAHDITGALGSVGVGTNSINASSILQVDSTTQGFLPPRMTNAQRSAISSPAVGLIVYCTDATEGLYVYKSGGWTFII